MGGGGGVLLRYIPAAFHLSFMLSSDVLSVHNLSMVRVSNILTEINIYLSDHGVLMVRLGQYCICVVF